MKTLLAGGDAAAVGVEGVGLDVVQARLGKGRDLILVMTDGEACLPLPVATVQENGMGVELDTAVLEGAVVGPHGGEAGDVAHGLAGKKVAGAGPVVVHAEGETVVEHAALQADVDAAGGFPLDGRILDVGQFQGRGLVHELRVGEVGARGVVVYVVIAAFLITGSQFQVVDRGDLEPVFRGDQPGGLDGGEQAPLHAGELDARGGFLTETGGGFHGGAGGEEVLVAVVVVGVQVIGQVGPGIVHAAVVLILE